MPTNSSVRPCPTRSGTTASLNDSSSARVKPTRRRVRGRNEDDHMTHAVWPLFDLEVRTPRLALRYVDDQLGAELTRLAAAGVHDPATMPFLHPWTDHPSPELEREALRFYWRCCAETSPENWHIVLAAIADGEVIGSCGLMASKFVTLRTFETGSWLGLPHHGKGLGTEMRIASLHVGFLAFDAIEATSGAFVDNPASLKISRKLGYQPNGTARHVRRADA